MRRYYKKLLEDAEQELFENRHQLETAKTRLAYETNKSDRVRALGALPHYVADNVYNANLEDMAEIVNYWQEEVTRLENLVADYRRYIYDR